MKEVALTYCADCIPRRLLRSLRQMPHNFFTRSSQQVVAQFTISLTKSCSFYSFTKLKELNSVAVVRKRNIPTERPPLVSEVSVNPFYSFNQLN
jgi:hypothetical protein